MKVEVSTAIEELKRQFSGSALTVRDDAQGGAYVVMEPFELGPKFQPADHLGRFSDSGAVSLCRHIPGFYRSRCQTR